MAAGAGRPERTRRCEVRVDARGEVWYDRQNKHGTGSHIASTQGKFPFFVGRWLVVPCGDFPEPESDKVREFCYQEYEL